MASLISLVRDANSALSLVNSAKSLVTTPSTPFPTKIVTHWSVYLMAGASIISAAMAVAVTIMGLYPLTVVGAILFVSCAIGALYLRRFMVLKTLDAIAQALTVRVRELNKGVDDLAVENNNLLTTVNEFHNQLREGTQERTRLQKELADRTKTLSTELNTFSSLSGERSQFAKELEKNRTAAEEVLKRAERSIDAAKDLTIKLCPKNVKNLGIMESTISSVPQNNEDSTEARENLRWSKIVAQLTALNEEKDKIIKQLQTQSSALDASSKRLEVANNDVNKNTDALHSLSNTVTKVVEQDQRLLKRVDALIDDDL